MTTDLRGLNFPDGGLMPEVRPWLESLVAQKYQPTTTNFMFKCMWVFDRYLRKRKGRAHARNVSAADLEAYRLSLIRRQLSPATQENYLQTVKSFFDWQEKRGMIFDNPARHLKILRRRRGLKYVPSEKEVVRLIESIPPGRPTGQRDRALVEVPRRQLDLATYCLTEKCYWMPHG